MSSPLPTFGRSAPTDRRASARCVRARSTAVSMLARDRRRQRAALSRCAACSCIRIAREALRQVVVDVAREAVALLENRLAPLLDAAAARSDRLWCSASAACRAIASMSTTRHHWLSGSGAAGCDSVIQPSVRLPSTSGVATIAAALHLRGRTRESLRAAARSSAVVLDRLRSSPACTRTDGRPGSRAETFAGRRRARVPVVLWRREEPILDVGHPEVAALRGRRRSARRAQVWLSLSSTIVLRQRAEESFDVGLAHQQIERELHDVGLHVRAALGAAPLAATRAAARRAAPPDRWRRLSFRHRAVARAGIGRLSIRRGTPPQRLSGSSSLKSTRFQLLSSWPTRHRPKGRDPSQSDAARRASRTSTTRDRAPARLWTRSRERK